MSTRFSSSSIAVAGAIGAIGLSIGLSAQTPTGQRGAGAAPAAPPAAAAVPAPYADVLTFLAKTGDFKDNVLRVNIPRNDVSVSVMSIATPTPFGFGGWIAMTKGSGMDVLMGDLVLLQDEVNPVLSALLDNGLEASAIHNHFFGDSLARRCGRGDG